MVIMRRMDQLRDWRKSQGISVDEAGHLVGVSGVQWHRYENGTRRVAPDKVTVVSKATGIPPEELRPDLASIFAPSNLEKATS